MLSVMNIIGVHIATMYSCEFRLVYSIGLDCILHVVFLL